MYIYPISHNNCNIVRFRANERFVADKSGHLAYKTTTYWYRGDTDWDGLGDYLCSKYKNTDKVNVICHACSNGMEPYSFAMLMKSSHSDYAYKFLPVIAKDIDKNNIIMAKRGHYEISDMDLWTLDYYTKGQYRDFFRLEPSHNYEIYSKSFAFAPNENLRKCVNFEQGDIFEDIENMPSKNTVLFCKNFWPYLTPEKREILVQKLSAHFDKSCVVITGDYDSGKSNVEELLIKYGFREHILIKNMWEKIK